MKKRLMFSMVVASHEFFWSRFGHHGNSLVIVVVRARFLVDQREDR
jgi:hypothetical protein